MNRRVVLLPGFVVFRAGENLPSSKSNAGSLLAQEGTWEQRKFRVVQRRKTADKSVQVFEGFSPLW
jgi:hypothetical protein